MNIQNRLTAEIIGGFNMRNWKHYGIICLLAFIVLAFIACDNDNGNNDPCNCILRNII